MHFKAFLVTLVFAFTIHLSQALPAQLLKKANESVILDWENEEVMGNPDEQGEYFEGDMMLTDYQIESLTSKSGIIGKNFRWPKGQIPYSIDGKFTKKQLDIIDEAMELVSANTCITFKKRKSEQNYVSIVLAKSGCSSAVGMRGKKQLLKLSNGCFGKGAGTPAHEMIHAIGFFHEQSRTDRDDYVKINWENIKDKKHEHNFVKYSSKKVWPFNVEYDYESIMHYGPYAFGKDKKNPTIQVRKKGATIGNRKDLSKKDVLKINRMYKCDKKKYPRE